MLDCQAMMRNIIAMRQKFTDILLRMILQHWMIRNTN
jgi:hypothetical protein